MIIEHRGYYQGNQYTDAGSPAAPEKEKGTEMRTENFSEPDTEVNTNIYKSQRNSSRLNAEIFNETVYN